MTQKKIEVVKGGVTFITPEERRLQNLESALVKVANIVAALFDSHDTRHGTHGDWQQLRDDMAEEVNAISERLAEPSAERSGG